MYLPIYVSTYLSIYLSVCLSIYLQAWKRSNSARHPHILKLATSKSSKTKQFCETSSFLKVDNITIEPILGDFFNFPTWQQNNAATQQDFLNFCTWQHKKRSKSARIPHFSKLTTSKTKQFCETSFKNGKLSAELTARYQCVLRFFQSICLNYCACHEKVMPGHTKCCTYHAKSSQQTWRSEAPKCNPSQEISARTS